MNIHISNNVGVSGAKVHWMRSKCGKYHWCKKAVAIMGSFNMTNEEIRTISPFDPRFHDNFIEGKGRTKEEALQNMQKEEKGLSDSLWAI